MAKKKVTKDKPKAQEKKLTPKEKRFCLFYVETSNASEAARRAGYPEKGARYMGYELLTKPHIKKIVEEMLTEQYQKLEINRDNVLAQARRYAFHGKRDYLGIKGLELMSQLLGMMDGKSSENKTSPGDDADAILKASERIKE